MPLNSIQEKNWRKKMSQPRVGAELILDTKTAQQQIKALNKQKV